jgi:hypothetical protein
VRDVSKDDAGVALDYLLALVRDGGDTTGDAFIFLKMWHEGKPLNDFKISMRAPLHVAFLCLALSLYITDQHATVRPIAFGRHTEVARLIKRAEEGPQIPSLPRP